MNDLLKSQFHENCKLALPEGLKDLMSDISREVLRAQPSNLYQFIANYLEALLEARETLTIACQVCTDLCKCTCEQIKPELYQELRKIGLDEEDIKNAIDVIEKHLTEAQRTNQSVKEDSLLLKLVRKTNIDNTQLPAIQQAVRKTITRYSLGRRDLKDLQNKKYKDPLKPVENILQLYNKQNKPKMQNETKEMYFGRNFQTCVTTVSSSTVAGSYIELPQFQPYSAHNSESLPDIPEKEHLLIDYTKVTESTNHKPITFEIDNKINNSIESHDKYKPTVIFDENIISQDEGSNESYSFVEQNSATTSTGLMISSVSNRNEEIDGDSEFSDACKDIRDEEDSNDELPESIENNESENESQVLSIAESIKDFIE